MDHRRFVWSMCKYSFVLRSISNRDCHEVTRIFCREPCDVPVMRLNSERSTVRHRGPREAILPWYVAQSCALIELLSYCSIDPADLQVPVQLSQIGRNLPHTRSPLKRISPTCGSNGWLSGGTTARSGEGTQIATFPASMRVISLLVLSAPLWAQSVLLLPAPPSRDGTGTVYLVLVASTGVAPAALQWRIQVPDGFAITPDDVSIVATLQGVEKLINCAAQPLSGSSAMVCVLYGGVQALPNGSVAQIHFRRTSELGPTVLMIDQILGATPAAKPVPFSDTGTSIASASRSLNGRQ